MNGQLRERDVDVAGPALRSDRLGEDMSSNSEMPSSASTITAPIVLAEMGSFHVGGRRVEVHGFPVTVQQLVPNGVPARFDPNGDYMVEQMYVQYFVPKTRHGAVPLLLWHGGGMTGVNYETTPDGREGWLNLFLRAGWAVYNCDAVERGRAGWPALPARLWQSEPVLIPVGHAAERFRIGAPDGQFPLQALEQFGRQFSPRWTTTDEPTFQAYLELVTRVGPCVILAHSQGGNFAFRVAQARPDLVRALVAVEPAGIGDPEAARTMHDVPLLLVYGDYIKQDARWPQMRQRGLDFCNLLRAEGGRADVIDLPTHGILGNSHMMMMERNNGEIAAVIRGWLQEQGLEE